MGEARIQSACTVHLVRCCNGNTGPGYCDLPVGKSVSCISNMCGYVVRNANACHVVVKVCDDTNAALVSVRVSLIRLVVAHRVPTCSRRAAKIANVSACLLGVPSATLLICVIN